MGRKRIRLMNLMGQFRDFTKNLELMNGYIQNEVETSAITRKNMSKKILVLFDKYHEFIE